MMKNFTLLFLLLSSSFIAKSQMMYKVGFAHQADVKVFEVEFAHQADLKVFKVEFAHQVEGNQGLWFFPEYSHQAKKKLFFVEFAHQADLKIVYVDHAHQAGWVNNAKKPLLY